MDLPIGDEERPGGAPPNLRVAHWTHVQAWRWSGIRWPNEAVYLTARYKV